MANSKNPARPFALFAEQFGPILLSLVLMAIVYSFRNPITDRLIMGDWQVNDLYSAVFNWSAIQTGFAFGVYGFVIGKTEGFIKAVRDTVAMRRFMRYVRTANIGGFLLTIASIPLTVANPQPLDADSILFKCVLAWFGLFIWTFLSFLRIAFNFGRLSSVPDEKPFYGA